MGTYTHKGSRDNLLGDQKNNPDLIALYSNELHVSENTPPTLFLLSDDDKSVPPANSIQMYSVMKEKGVLHRYIFPEGGMVGVSSYILLLCTWPALMCEVAKTRCSAFE